MAKLAENIALVLGTQSGEGVINATVRDSTQIGTTEGGPTALGLLLRRDSLGLDLDRLEELAEQDVPASFTRQRGFKIRTAAGAFTFDFTLRGSGQTTTTPTPIAGEFNLVAAVEALLRGTGLNRGTPTTSETPYALTSSPDFLTMKVWRGNQSFVFQDCKVRELSIALTPKQVVVVSVDVVPGPLTHRPADTFPTVISYGLQTTTPPPVLRAAGAQIGSVVRGFLEGSLLVSNEYEEIPDSNLPEGCSNEQSARVVSWEGNFYADSADHDQDFVNLDLTTAPVDELRFQLGATNVPGQVANAIEFTMFNVNFTQQSLVEQTTQNRRIVWGLQGYATAQGTTPDSEFSFRSR